MFSTCIQFIALKKIIYVVFMKVSGINPINRSSLLNCYLYNNYCQVGLLPILIMYQSKRMGTFQSTFFISLFSLEQVYELLLLLEKKQTKYNF